MAPLIQYQRCSVNKEVLVLMKYEDIIYSREKNIAIITLNRPKVLNALTLRLIGEFNDAVNEANKDDSVRVIVITGSGRAFCAGDDVKNMFGTDEAPGEEVKVKGREMELAYLEHERLYSGAGILLTINKPLIAAVNGVAAGYGCTIAILCDIRIASEKARFAELFLQVGLIPGEGLFQLPKVVNLGKAYEMFLTAEIIDADEAYRIGLVNRVVPHEQLMTATMELAAKIASRPPIAVRLIKEGIRKGLALPGDEFNQWKSLAQRFCLSSQDHKEASRAFIEKRSPVVKGK